MSGQPIQESFEETENRPQRIEQIPEIEITERPVDTRSITELSSTSDPKIEGHTSRGMWSCYLWPLYYTPLSPFVDGYIFQKKSEYSQVKIHVLEDR